MTVKVRIAPSPTGNLHIGTARTALFNWLFAKRHGGEFILRIEDTDLERSEKKYEQSIIEGLKWLGINWDGEIFRQSERLPIYRRYLEQLLSSGKAFWCHHTVEELEAEQKAQMERKEAPRHVCEHKHNDKGKQPGQIIRLAVDEQSGRKIGFEDIIRGHIESQEQLLSDISLAKNLDTSLYNFSVVIDDIEMAVTHVIRGEDHISNTPKQLLIYEALDIQPPQFAHLPLILGPDRTKLSKRHGATDLNEYKKDYLPEALVNFMGFLGYTYSKEILSKEEMAQEFELTKVHKSGAIFNINKLNWFNAQYVRKLSPKQFKKLTNIEIDDSAVPLITERLEKLSDVQGFAYLWQEPEYESDLLIWKKSDKEKTILVLEKLSDVLKKIEWQREQLQLFLEELSQEVGDRGTVYWPFRVALTGKEKSPDPIDIAVILKKEETLKRVAGAIKKLNKEL